MKTIRVVPCLDVDAGRVVKAVKFVDVRDAGDPVELAAKYDEQGADELVFYDITASSDDRNTMVEVVERTADCVFIPLTVGGGVRTADDARAMLRAGADKVSINSAALKRPELVNEIAYEFGSQCAVLSMDVKRRTDAERKASGGSAWHVYLNGGRVETGRDALVWAIEGAKRGAGEFVLNSIDRDGTKDGYDVELISAISREVDVPVVASGGVGTLDHLVDGVRAGADAVLAASIFHFGTYSIAEAKDHLRESGFIVRP